MSSSDGRLHTRRNTLRLLLATTVLGACQFRPVYGPEGAGSALEGRVVIAAPSTTRDFTMAQQLERRFGPVSSPDYTLDFSLRTFSQDAAVTSGQEIERVNLVGTLNFTLRSAATGARVARGTAEGFVSYSSAGEPVAINAALKDAELRLASILADRTQIILLNDSELRAHLERTGP